MSSIGRDRRPRLFSQIDYLAGTNVVGCNGGSGGISVTGGRSLFVL
jgi:hypothetical protein